MIAAELKTLRLEDTYDEIETWSQDEVLAWQLDRVRAVAAWAGEGNDFYSKRWRDAGVDSRSIESWSDFQALPIVGKPDLVAAGPAWSPRTGRVAFSTRGTSGEPLVVWLDNDEQESFIPATIRGFWWAGYRPGETALMMSPAWHRLAAMEGHAALRMGGRVAYFWGSGGPQYGASFIDAVRKIEPRFVTTTAPFIVSLVRRCVDEEIDAHELFASVRSMIAVGLPLTPQLRTYLSEQTGTEVFERSGTQEGAAADECAAHTAPHVHADVCHLEVLDADGTPAAEGERGRLVVTKLQTTGDPVIRYDTGDIAELHADTCECGRSLPRLKIYGRPESSVVVNGRAITAYDVRACVDANPELVGRLVLLVRDCDAPRDELAVAIEGDPADADGIAGRIAERFGIENVNFKWLGSARMAWGFRQVVDRSEV